MKPERWRQVKATLATALEQNNESERRAFLEAACAGDTALRIEVESLLAQADDKFEATAAAVGAANAAPILNIGRRVGAYELIRQLGRGGMGTVWLARRADQHFEKLAAIKLLKRGTDTDEVLRRFRAERQILAQLEHPNIARLLDGGVTDDGLPYFVMEYVEGKPVTVFARSLTLRQRLQLFLKVCDAVQFAHQNLVVHRDLKPGNILVTPRGEPKLLDFGIAKLLAPGDDALLATMGEQQRLTPAYASPEQIRGEPVTTASDIYALGALLSEVLSGQSAHRFPAAAAPTSELLRLVLEGEPLRPSAAVSGASMELAGRSLKNYAAALRGDLDNIVLKALRKEPARRYASVGALAEDICRHLEERPVHARKDTVAYRTLKFYRRNKLAVAASLLVLITLLGGIAATAYQARAERKQRARAERRFNDVRRIANSFLFEFHDLIADVPGALAARRLVAHRAVEYLDSLAEEAGDDLSLQGELAAAYQKIGSLSVDQSHGMDARTKAVRLNERLVSAAPDNVAYRLQLSESYERLSDALKLTGHSEQAIEYGRRAVSVIESLLAQNPGDAGLRASLADRSVDLGAVLSEVGDFRQALRHHLKAMAIQEQLRAEKTASDKVHHDLAVTYGQAGDAYRDLGDLGKAALYTEKEISTSRMLYHKEPANARYRRDMWASHYRLGQQCSITGEENEAIENYRRALEFLEPLSLADAQDNGHRRWLAMTHLHLARSLAKLGQIAEALARVEQGIQISEELAGADPQLIEAHRDLIEMYGAAGVLLVKASEFERATDLFQRAETLAKNLIAQDPHNARVRGVFAQLSVNMAEHERALAQRPELDAADRAAKLSLACQLYEQSRALWAEVKQQGMLRFVDTAAADAAMRAASECAAGALASKNP